ncbi:trehalose-phosphatase [Arenibaculum sp.]|jgi:trehalose 6-phosphate phosphatase|uniref:trehalose-phosphatase n=1 Tax=Arenibaculum sp. TaxID=2865862 RepID=UPI002E123D73|nr:trehalose-phosphatase [Arenibaculum sp.]
MPPPAPLTDLPLDRRWALFLDFDGTLVDIAPRPDAVRVADGLPDLLAELGARLGGALALVSGRPIAELDRFLAPALLPAGGQHGLEWRDADGARHEAEIDRAALAEIRAELEAFVEDAPGTRLEAKSMSVALHYRQAPEFEAAALEVVERLATRYAEGFHVQGGKMVLEVKPRGADKGTVVERFLAAPPFAGRVPVYVGDDLTDEHGFVAVEGRGGIAIQVGAREPTVARWRTPTVGDLHLWLGSLAAHLRES